MNKKKIKVSSNRSFGIVFFIVFFAIGIWPVFKGNDYKFWFLIVSLFFLILGILKPKLLAPLNKIWIKFGMFLGKIVSPIIMFIIFVFIVTPTGLLMKLFGKDLLNHKFNKKSKTYWQIRKKKTSMKKQF